MKKKLMKLFSHMGEELLKWHMADKKHWFAETNAGFRYGEFTPCGVRVIWKCDERYNK